MSFQDVLSILSGQRFSIENNSPALSMSLAQSACHNYSLSGANSCGTIPGRTLFFDIPAFSPLEYESEAEGWKDGNGIFKKNFRRTDPYIVFEVIGNDSLFHILKDIEDAEVITFTDIQNASSAQVLIMKTEASDEPPVLRVKVSILIEGSSQVFKACCGSLFDGTEYDPCDGTVISQDPACVDYDVQITFSDPTLSAATTGGPAGVETFVWYLDELGNGIFVEIGTGNSFNPVLPGIYKVVAKKGTCQDEATYIYQGSCIGYAVTIQLVAGVLIGTANLLTGTWKWYKDGVLQDTTSDPFYTPEASGNWTVVGETAGGCTDESDPVAVTYIDCGEWLVSIERADDILTASHDCLACGTPAWQWSADFGDGSGLQDLAGETNAALDISSLGRGFYQVALTMDGCTKYSSFLVIDDCVAFKAYIAALSAFPPNYARLQAASYNPPNGTSVSFEWFVRVNEAWQLAFAGNPFDLEEKRAVKLRATAGSCVKEEELYFCVDPDLITPYQAFSGTGAELAFEVTEFTVPYPDDQGGPKTENQINGDHEVTRNGVALYYVPLADLGVGQPSANDRRAYSWDYANNEVELPNGWPLGNGEVLAVRKLR